MAKYLKIYFIVVLILNVLAADVFLYLLWSQRGNKVSVDNDKCPLACKEMIDNKVKDIVVPTVTTISIVPTGATVLTPTTRVITQNSKKIRSTQYIPIPGNGSTLENKWTDLAGTEFYISTDDYSGLVGAYFEANMRLINGNGMAYLRLFDVTAGVEVWGSEVSTSSQSFTSVSSAKMTIRPGNHLYRVQARSLTADTTVFNSGRIKVILEN